MSGFRIDRLAGQSHYTPVWLAMQDYTEMRTAESPDHIWLVEHAPVYTLGQAAKSEHLLNVGDIPVVQTDRGGQVTYHGPGQAVAYCLMDLRRARIFVKEYVFRLEQAVIDTLAGFGVRDACRKPGAPGVYVTHEGDEAKIAALGLKIRNGCSYHGAALNVDMDLQPFQGINPCGYAGLRTVDLATLGVHVDFEHAGQALAAQIDHQLGHRAMGYGSLR